MARISELLAEGPTFSFEFMPPRTPEAEAQLEQTLLKLEPLQPSFVSVTYGAGGSTRERTNEMVVRLLHDTNITPMAHLTCAAHSKVELTEILQRYAAEGLENLLALRGDPPLDGPEKLKAGELTQAYQLIDLARQSGDFCVAVAMHPEGHPKAPDRITDRKHQAAKLSQADFGLTQFFFDVEDYLGLVDDMAKLGVEKPIIPGIMPPSNVAQLSKMATMSGAEIPDWVHQRLATAGDDAKAVRSVGVEIATELSRSLLDAGAPGLHFYTMNKSASTRQIYANLGLANAY